MLMHGTWGFPQQGGFTVHAENIPLILNTSANGTDPLTGLKDRTALIELNRKFSLRNQVWSLVIIDIDHFKLVNDIYGHLAGDEVLSHVGQTIKVNLKRNDHALRFGGDEFVVILPDTDGNCALDLAQRLLYELESREFPGGLKISASLGIAQSKPADCELSDLISMADQALYRAKETGRGRFVLADDLKIQREVEPDFSHMVGRRDELRQLRELLDNSMSCAGFCLITGFQGTGKTKLVDEFLNYCQFRQTPVYKTEASLLIDEENSLILDLLRKALADLPKKQLDSLKNKLNPLECITAEQLDGYSFETIHRTLSAEPQTEKARNRRDLASILIELSNISPMVLILDNLQYASPESIEFAAGVISSAPEANLFYIAISRSATTWNLLKSLWTRVSFNKIHLDPLSKSNVRTMVFFAMKSPGVPVDVLDYMMRQSGGNALFLRKLISWCIETGSLRIGKGDLCLWREPEEQEFPLDICSIIEMMLADCSEAEMKVLKRAALAGTLLNLDLLTELTSMRAYELAETLDRFVENGFLQDDGNKYSFSYGVMRSHLISRISPSFRRILHEKTAESLLLRYSPVTAELSLTTEIAHHFCNSGNKSEALKFSKKAAQLTFSAGFHSESIHWYREYLNLVSADDDPKDFFKAHINIGILFSITGKAELAEKHITLALTLTDDPVDLCGVYHRLGDNYQRRSMYPKAMEFFEKTLEEGYSLSTRTSVLINDMLGALLGLSFIYRIQSSFMLAAAKLEQARQLLDGDKNNYEPVIEGMYFARLADLEAETGSSDKALLYYEKGLEICIEGKDPAGEAVILNNMHDLYAQKGDYNSMLDTLKKVIKLNRKLDDQLGLAIGYYNLAESYTQLNMLDLARRYFQMYIELNSKIENRLGMAYGHLGLGKLSLLNQKGDQAVDYFRKASEIFSELNCTDMMYDSQLETVKALLTVGDFQACRDILSSLPSLGTEHQSQSILLHLRGVLMLHPANADENPASLTEAVTAIQQSISDTIDPEPDEIVYLYGNLLLALEESGNFKEGVRVLEKALDLLESQLSSISSESIRNSILSRSDIVNFLSICRKKGIANPLLND